MSGPDRGDIQRGRGEGVAKTKREFRPRQKKSPSAQQSKAPPSGDHFAFFKQNLSRQPQALGGELSAMKRQKGEKGVLP